jgi:hypothetical protein
VGRERPEGDVVDVDGRPGIVHDKGLLIAADDGAFLNINVLKIGGRTISASGYGKTRSDDAGVEFTEEERLLVEKMREIWEGILGLAVDDDLDFFNCGEYCSDSRSIAVAIAKLEAYCSPPHCCTGAKQTRKSHEGLVIIGKGKPLFCSLFLAPLTQVCHFNVYINTTE